MQYVIIGNGITGITAARTIRKHSDDQIMVISGETDYFFSRTALMYVYMGHMQFEHTQPYEKHFWKKNRIELKRAWVTAIDTEKNSLLLNDGSVISYDRLLIATGATPNKFSWPGQHLKGVQGLYSYQDLLELEENTRNGIQRAVIVGGGLIGIEMAEMLHSRKYPVTILVRESKYWNNVLPEQDAHFISEHIRSHGFDLRLNTHLKEVHGDENGRVKYITTNDGETINCEVVGLTAGVSPNIEWMKNGPVHIDRGVLINQHMGTNIENIFAAGDCAQFQHALPGRKNIEQVWYTGKLQGETAAFNMLGEKTLYDPGHWFNSAKFLDIEYQTYGTVLNTLKEGESSFFWQHADGLKALHLVFNTQHRTFIGINVYGIRLRHQLFNRWLQEKQSVEFVLGHLRAANFDPEFFAHFESDIIQLWNAKHPAHQVSLQPKNALDHILFA